MLKRIFYLIFGTLGIIISILITGWIIYNLLIEKVEGFREARAIKDYFFPISFGAISYLLLKKGLKCQK